ncbi:MAG: alpha-hydroxy-acid oxidizing protein [Acidimicrobiia bacterium]|nr:alpha-hydroxy-acid oxidizing protein [Acidimicrobiia bacterium]MDH4307588.1 alpha-hydroxy-acid oxidizing protein [Acidimicrobiia bacterium]MDH5292813.1 alpha-hydroxy-acid oxidizing protein [Acidimicrobiia bacterium]
MSDFVTIGQLLELARSEIDADLYGWAAAGAGEEVTVARNAQALDSLALVSRIGRNVEAVDTSTSIAAIPQSLPIFLAPVGALSRYHDDGALGAARAAAGAGVSAFCSMLVSEPWEDIAATAPGRHIFQIYIGGDHVWTGDVVDRAIGAGFGALCVTVDTPEIGRRDRSLESGFIWSVDRHERPDNLARHGKDMSFRTRYTWDDFAWLCEYSDLPVIIKGILHPDDARRAVELGATVVYVSNHGGRVIDHEVSSIEMLAEVADAVAGDAEILIDSGFQRGPEVLKALALGARAVGLGRSQIWALGVGGREGVSRLIEILREEIGTTMANLGVTAPDQLGPGHVRSSSPTR